MIIDRLKIRLGAAPLKDLGIKVATEMYTCVFMHITYSTPKWRVSY